MNQIVIHDTQRDIRFFDYCYKPEKKFTSPRQKLTIRQPFVKVDIKATVMNVISKRPFIDAAKKHPNDRAALIDMYIVLHKTNFQTPEELRAVFPSLDNYKYKDGWWVIDVGGNNLRVIAFIQFVNKRMYIKHICNHADYDKLTAKHRSQG